jgi:hypothetical protein
VPGLPLLAPFDVDRIRAVRRATIEARKQFAAELAERDAQPRFARDTPVRAARRDGVGVPADSQSGPAKAARTILPPTDAEILERYRMRRWWLDRYSLDEIRELAACLR